MTLLISDTGGDAGRIPPLVRTLREHRVEGLFYVADHHQRVEPAGGRPGGAAGAGERLRRRRDALRPARRPARPAGADRGADRPRPSAHRLPDAADRARGAPPAARRLPASAGRGRDRASTRRSSSTPTGTERRRSGRRCARRSTRCCALDAPPTVLCCGNDRLAVTVYGILRARGIAVPEEMSVAGYDDYRVISETLYPPLTTMELPYGRMGEARGAADARRPARRRDGAARNPRIEVRGELRWRASVTPGPADATNNQPRRKTMTRLDADRRDPARLDVPGRRGCGADRAQPLVPRRRQRGGARRSSPRSSTTSTRRRPTGRW